MKLKIFYIFLLLFLITFMSTVIIAQGTTSDQTELEKKIAEYEKKLGELRQQKNTLSSQIQYMDTQIYITTLNIQDTEQKIVNTQKEIDLLTSRIDGLDNSLNYLSKLLLQRIVEGYKKKSISILSLFFDSVNANEFLNQMKYLKTVQENNQKLLIEVQQTKTNFEQQKTLREQKKKDLDNLKITLDKQKLDLNNQKVSKQRLLDVTQNDEDSYQRLLEEAQRQLSAFKSFVKSTGTNTIPANGLGTGEGGWYMSQRDERWAYKLIGNSNENILDVGCFITSIAMVLKYYGSDFTPVNLTSNSNYFVGNTAFMYKPDNFNGSWPKNLRYRNIEYSEIKDYLNRNIPVIAGVRNASHYVVLKKTIDNDFIMNDPIYGPDIKVSDYYSISGPYGVFE